ncbi:MAG: SPOR domain-containing protein [Helicobacteraceae bacterium]|jgi:cell division septation protein DedD|nr:SPOR domain-containing protein [Helicobacteraceae bacterium]
MPRLLGLAICAVCLSFADNFIESKAWVQEDSLLIDQGFPVEESVAKPPLTMPKTPLPSIEPILQNETGRVAPPREPNFQIEEKSAQGETSPAFWVQIGAFANAQSAIDLGAILTAQGYNVEVFAKDLSRVVIGPYASVNEAEDSLRQVKASEPDAFITTTERLK